MQVCFKKLDVVKGSPEHDFRYLLYKLVISQCHQIVPKSLPLECTRMCTIKTGLSLKTLTEFETTRPPSV